MDKARDEQTVDILRAFGAEPFALAAALLDAREKVARLTRDRGDFQRKYFEAMDILSAPQNLDRAVAIGRMQQAEARVTALRKALADVQTFLDVDVRSWVPTHHEACDAACGCADAERQMFEAVDRRLKAISAALALLARDAAGEEG